MHPHTSFPPAGPLHPPSSPQAEAHIKAAEEEAGELAAKRETQEKLRQIAEVKRNLEELKKKNELQRVRWGGAGGRWRMVWSGYLGMGKGGARVAQLTLLGVVVT